MEQEWLWKLFLETGSPEVYVRYHQAAAQRVID
jgi:hypothetical protein